MVKKDIKIVNKLGLHARAAAKLVALASKFSSSIEIVKENRSVNGKSIMGVMMLAASKGSYISIQIEGSDEEEAMEKLEELINDKFGEEE